ncbi:MAG TPA: MBOAT family O-acyltransferase [Candidatus Binatia bacterium]|nr:MBOAT family O-acyltransferase [Candidatus Binatia bacterium]
MRFDSAEFLLFFLVVLILHRTVAWRRVMLTVASYIFYASWNPPFLLLLLATSWLDYAVAQAMDATESQPRRRMLLGISLAGNLGILAYFKYVNFLWDNLVAAGIASQAALTPYYVDVQIPLGISFYTFQTLGYTVDVYRREVRACRNLTDFSLFITFFPQLIAGPIVRAKEFLPQIARNTRASMDDMMDGIELCLVGVFQKVVLADNFAIVADRCYAAPAEYSGISLLVGSAAFAVQMYCDFAGYSTIARGLGKMLGYDLPENFFFPLLAPNPIEYRRRWHITMGEWFRDYVYRPLGGDRGGNWKMIRNTLLTWTGFGLWHGASWTFLLWGLYNGVLLVAYRLMRRAGWFAGDHVGYTIAGYLSMPILIGSSYVFFRSQTVSDAFLILGRIVTMAPGKYEVHPAWGLAILGLYGLHWLNYLYYTEPVLRRVGWPQRTALVTAGIALLVLLAGSGKPFYYFQF